MFRSVVLCLAVLLLAMPASAGPIQAGVKGGINVANVSTDDSASELQDSRMGMALGGYVAVPVNPMFSVQPEAIFTMKGDKESADGVDASLKLNYIEIPVLAKLTLAPAATARPSLFAGPMLGINVSAKAEAASVEVDVKDETKSTEFGMVFGGGLEMPVGPLGKQSVGLDVRYTLGLSSIDDSAAEADVKNGVLSIMGTFRFL